MPDIKVPGYVKKSLLPGETVIGKTTKLEKDLYATDKRVLVFQKPGWIYFIYLLGVLPGLIAVLTAPKTLTGSLEYSRMSGIQNKPLRFPTFQYIGLGGIVLCLIMSIIFIASIRSSDIPEAWWIGLLPVAVSLIFVAALVLRKFPTWQIELAERPGAQPEIWRIPQDKGGGKLEEQRSFADLVGRKIRK
jgi:hypothetical protein